MSHELLLFTDSHRSTIIAHNPQSRAINHRSVQHINQLNLTETQLPSLLIIRDFGLTFFCKVGGKNLWLRVVVFWAYRYIKKKLNIMKKCQYFLSLISKSETHILYRLIIHRVKYFKPLQSSNFDDYGLQIRKTQNSVSPKIRILHKINKKLDILYRNVRLLISMFISMHSISF